MAKTNNENRIINTNTNDIACTDLNETTDKYPGSDSDMNESADKYTGTGSDGNETADGCDGACSGVTKEPDANAVRDKKHSIGNLLRCRLFRRILLTILLLGVLGACGILGMNHYVRSVGGSYLVTEETSDCTKEHPADCALVLGASVYGNRKPSPMLQDRLDKAIELYKSGIVKKLLFTGDNGQVEYNEVESMKEYALDKGVKGKDIFLDHAGFSTYESVYRAKSIFQVENMIVVTQQYHEYRALYIAKKMGITAQGIPTEQKPYVGDTMREIREILARTKDMVKCMYMPEPTFLGDTISITGNGKASW